MYKILVINPGATSTKLSIFEDDKEVISESIEHSRSEIENCKTIMDQLPFRKECVEDFLKRQNISIDELDAIAARGGILPPMKSGTYRVNENMVNYLKTKTRVEHASSLAAVIAFELSKSSSKDLPVFITDPISVDEFIPEARISGIPQLERHSLFHALNMKIVARFAAKELSKEYEKCNFVIAHLGGGISVGAQRKGFMIDVNNATDEGPFSSQRTGELPMGDLAKWIFKNMPSYSKNDATSTFVGKGGLFAYLKTASLKDALKFAEKDEYAKLIVKAMAYQVAKEIGGMAAILGGDLDAIILTGGMAHSDYFVELIKRRIDKLGVVMVYPGAYEMEGLALGALRALKQLEDAKVWEGENIL